MKSHNKSLEQLREEIDKLDNELVSLFAKRMKIAEAVGKYKTQHGLQPLDNKRWKSVLESRISLGNKVGLSSDFIRSIFKAIHKQSLLIQKNSQL